MRKTLPLLEPIPVNSPIEHPDRAAPPLSITDFLTDGSLAALCAELGSLTGVPVQLRDASGRLIHRRAGASPDDKGSWVIVDEPLADAEGAATSEANNDAVIVPLKLGTATIGTFTIHPGEPRLAKDARAALERTLAFLARTAGELCEHELDLRHRMKEVAALSRVSSLLIRASGPERVLEVALESVLDAMELDAGSIVLLKEDADGVVTTDSEEDLVLAASRNLSRDWLDSPLPLSRNRLFDRLALQGEIVISEDIAGDDRVLIRERAKAEGLGAAIHAGLVFQNRPIGVIRLYSRLPRRFADTDRRLLRSIAAQAAVAVEQARLLRFEREEQRVQRQLELAADVQRRMLPESAPSFPALQVAAKYTPSFELGGDFYDYVDLNGHFGLVVGDVVGKGIAAALLMSATRAALRAHVQEVYDLDEVISRVNVQMCRDTKDNEFVSIWYGVIDPLTLRLTYCSAGHEPTLVIHVPAHRPPTPADIDELGVGGMVVGIDSSQRYQRAVFDLRPRDVILAYTDGLTDTVNFARKRFGKKRLRETLIRALTENPSLSAADLIERLMWEVRQFAGLSPRPDDNTMVVVRVLDGAPKRR